MEVSLGKILTAIMYLFVNLFFNPMFFVGIIAGVNALMTMFGYAVKKK